MAGGTTRPNATVYLLSDTGMDMQNSIWWDKYAYQDGPKQYQWYWHGVKAHWFKAHSFNSGYWYMNMVNAYQGYVDVGRIPLNDLSIPMWQEGLGSDRASDESRLIPYSEILLGTCDYIMFANGINDQTSQWYYAFVDTIEPINFNTARVHFTIDAIETYGQYFNFGPSMVVRDMQHLERKADNTPNKEYMNYEPEPFTPSNTDYVFQRLGTDQPLVEKSNLGKYSRVLVMSDVSLRESDITPNQYYGGLPSFKMSESSVEGAVYLGIGVYYLPSRKCATLDLLGSYNAIEHLLYTYMVPEKLTSLSGTSGEPIFLGDMQGYVNAGYKGDVIDKLLTPIKFSDKLNATADQDGFEPLNLKCYSSPTTYVSIGDKQGGSLEIDLQNLEEFEVTPSNFFNLRVLLNLSISPNVGSCLYVLNNQEYEGGEHDPMVTLWQMPSYSMTPNNSGYNQDYVEANMRKRMALKYTLLGTGLGMVGSLSKAAISMIPGGTVAGSIAKAGSSLAGNPIGDMGSNLKGYGMRNMLSAITATENAKMKEVYGLPKAVGGSPQGFTRYNMNYAGYEYFFVHQKTSIIKKYDMMYTIYGYQQNEFRYPNINTRRRWTFVQLDTVNIIDKGHTSAVPSWARNQIEERLKSGVTFWNVRWALLGDGDKDADPQSIQSFDDSRIQQNLGHNFVRNYGNFETREYMKENLSIVGGYCDDYSPYPSGNGLLPPD